MHKSWACAHSDFFPQALSWGFKEAGESKIQLDGDEPQVVEAFV